MQKFSKFLRGSSAKRWLLAIGSLGMMSSLLFSNSPEADAPRPWSPPSLESLPQSEQGDLVRYGRDLIANTSHYLGPNGSVAQLSNSLNCQNCHLDAGTKMWGNNYFGVASTYPLYRDRSGTVETIHKRISDCFERSLNGTPPEADSREMKAIIAYIEWLGADVPKKTRPEGTGLKPLPFLDRAADPEKGKAVYDLMCFSCHGTEGQGLKLPDAKHHQFPPLWGDESYNTGAGLYRLSRFASYVKYNMPLGIDPNQPMLTDEQAWDVAAYVNSRPRPVKDQSGDWKEIAKKPIDHPVGPYADSFTEEQHKFGPFKPILEAREKSKPQTK